jgi:predicted MFS family arabinose efflux permease
MEEGRGRCAHHGGLIALADPAGRAVMRQDPGGRAATLASRHPLLAALGLALGAAVALGMARFAYALLVSPMRIDLGWSWLMAGAMNTGNALGYFLGALIAPWAMRRRSARTVFIASTIVTALAMVASGFTTHDAMLFALRLIAGICGAMTFISGGLLAARLGGHTTGQTGLVLGLYYAGAGLGITISALLVPFVLARVAGQPHDWQAAWIALGLVGLLAGLALVVPSRGIATPAGGHAARSQVRLIPLAAGLAGYGCFGLGYIGYMTFIVALLRADGFSETFITVFYALLGAASMGSARLWAGLLDRHRSGKAMALLNGLLGVATLLPVVATQSVLIFVSGILFGAVFLSLVASSTAMVRHNLPAADWGSGIGAFTAVFGAGQVLGPMVVGHIADITGGLRPGLALSACVLLLGAMLARLQRPLPVAGASHAQG